MRIGGGEKGGEAMPLRVRAGVGVGELSIVSNTHHFFSASAE